MLRITRRFVDNEDPHSFATRLRRKRFALFKSIVSNLPRPLEILDVGGTPQFWEIVGFVNERNIKITLLNIFEMRPPLESNLRCLIGDARNMCQFRDSQFDIVFSNSVIEHVGSFGEQRKMADELVRVGKGIFLQTPNRFFPIEPHFLVPFFQFYPLAVQLFLLRHFTLGRLKNKVADRQKASEILSSIRLLTEKELNVLFPGAIIRKEKVFGFTKSFIVQTR
jgi:hypothetical protein